jgi:hypothetical protein
MLDRLDLRVSFGDGCGTVIFDNILDARLYLRFPLKIDAPEFDACIRCCRQEIHGHPVPAVEADAGKAGRPIESLLL